jgi:hypothetical protein
MVLNRQDTKNISFKNQVSKDCPNACIFNIVRGHYGAQPVYCLLTE